MSACPVCGGRDLGMTDGPDGEQWPVVCGACTPTCPICEGEGSVAVNFSVQSSGPCGIKTCPACDGSGVVPSPRLE